MQDLGINLHGVNTLHPSFERDILFTYKHYHLEITASDQQERDLKQRLYAEGLAVNVQPFDLNKHSLFGDAEQRMQYQTPIEGRDSRY